MTNAQAEAISQMAPASHGYNRGVLAMLGKESLAGDHEMVCRTIEDLVAQRDALLPDPQGVDDLLADLPPEAAKIQAYIDEASARRSAAWALIQSMIDEARAELDAADPMGMRQHA